MKLAVCIPHSFPYCVTAWQNRIRDELLYPPVDIPKFRDFRPTEFLETTSIPVETARNELVTRAFYRGASHVLFVDDDIWPPVETLKYSAVLRLLGHDKDIVGGMCKYRTTERKFVIFPQELQDGAGLVEVDETGCGFLLIKMEVFVKIAGQFDFGDVEFFRWAGSTRAPNGEDSSFCRLAKKHGFSIWIDRDIKCGHHDTVIFDDSKQGFSQIRRGYKEGKPVEKITISKHRS